MYKLLLAEDEPPIVRAVKKTFESAGEIYGIYKLP